MVERPPASFGSGDARRCGAIDVSAGAVDCEGDEVVALETQMNKKEAKRDKVLTVASIFVGAATGTASAILAGVHDDAPAAGVAIGGAGVSAALSIAALGEPSYRFKLDHPQNLLREKCWTFSSRK
ncbi:MAG TPA: hypothetical protein VGI39_19090 [Polyangiaceae bacterium]